MKQIRAIAEKCQNNTGCYELWIVDEKKGYPRFKKYLSPEQFEEIKENPKYDLIIKGVVRA